MNSMKWKLVLVAVSIAVLLVACGPKEVAQEAPEAPVVPQPVVTPDATVSDIESSVTEVAEIDVDLDTSELDQLEQDLAALDALDLG